MKVAILSFYQNFVSRGVETFVQELSQRVPPDCQLKVYHPDSRNSLKAKKDATNTLRRHLFIDYYSRQIGLFAQRTLKLLAADPPDILMALNNGWMSLLSKRFCQKYPTKLVLAGFSGLGWDDKVNLWLNPDRFIACTAFQADWAKTINSQAKISTIHIGVNTQRFTPKGSRFNHGLKPPVVLTVAGPQAYKRVDLAIKAVSRLKNVSLLVVGRQPENINLLAKDLLKTRYKNITVDYQHLDPVYRSADSFTLPSQAHEAYGIAILEALSSNLPVVVNRDPIRQELVGSSGWLINPDDLNQYTQALGQSLKTTPTDRYRQQALKFSWDKIVIKHHQLWQKLLSN